VRSSTGRAWHVGARTQPRPEVHRGGPQSRGNVERRDTTNRIRATGATADDRASARADCPHTGRACRWRSPSSTDARRLPDGDSQATERIQRERSEAALIAKQQEQIKELQRRRRAKPSPSRAVTVVQPPATQSRPRSDTSAPTRTDDWPGGSGYTTILASVGSQAEARSLQSIASGRGLDAGVLLGSNYRSLRPGYCRVLGH
jgi:hypothetical protein